MGEVDKYTGLTQERFDLIMERYRNFQESCDDLTKAPVKVYDKISPKSLAELELIREVSRDLQKKKEEDARKAAQAKEEEAAEVKKEEPAAAEVEEEKKVE